MGPAAIDRRWTALTNAGTVVAALAGIAAAQPSERVRDFPALIRACSAWRQDLAENRIADLTAVMEPGIAVLLKVNARGDDPTPAARALWHEFDCARNAILGLLPDKGCAD